MGTLRLMNSRILTLIAATFCAWLLSAPTACNTEDGAARRCVEQVSVWRQSPGLACGEKTTLTIHLCERLPEKKCTTKEDELQCIISPDNQGYLVILEPCHSVESIPAGWVTDAEENPESQGVTQCHFAETPCE